MTLLNISIQRFFADPDVSRGRTLRKAMLEATTPERINPNNCGVIIDLQIIAHLCSINAFMYNKHPPKEER